MSTDDVLYMLLRQLSTDAQEKLYTLLVALRPPSAIAPPPPLIMLRDDPMCVEYDDEALDIIEGMTAHCVADGHDRVLVSSRLLVAIVSELLWRRS